MGKENPEKVFKVRGKNGEKRVVDNLPSDKIKPDKSIRNDLTEDRSVLQGGFSFKGHKIL